MLFNENSLYQAIVLHWGEHGAHAEVFRDICRKADIHLEPVELSLEEIAREIWVSQNRNKIRAIKELRYQYEDMGLGYLGLREAKAIIDSVAN